jgi:hypothetical protein
MSTQYLARIQARLTNIFLAQHGDGDASCLVMGLSLDLLSHIDYLKCYEAAGTCGYRLEPHLRRAHAV